MTDLSPPYMQARTVLRQLTKHMSTLYPATTASSHPNSPNRLNLPALPTFAPAERNMVLAWKNYLKWEETNPLEVDEKDKDVLVQRIIGAYRKALIRVRFFPEIWLVRLALT